MLCHSAEPEEHWDSSVLLLDEHGVPPSMLHDVAALGDTDQPPGPEVMLTR